jgi:uncharacterized protein (TIGR02246 family)
MLYRPSEMSIDEALIRLYTQLIDGWNSADAEAMAAPIASNGLVIGFDGSQMLGREEVATELANIFADHETAKYVTRVRSVVPLGNDAAALHAVAGMVPPGGSEIMPDRNAIQTVVGTHVRGTWQVALFQTTPALFDGRPELTESLTAELNEISHRRPG